MNGQMKSFNMKKYYESLKQTPEPIATRIVAIDYKGLLKYAQSKGVEPYLLEEDEKEMFVIK